VVGVWLGDGAGGVVGAGLYHFIIRFLDPNLAPELHKFGILLQNLRVV